MYFLGTGRSKKTAKRTAAANMLAQLKAISQDKEAEKALEDSDEDEEIPLVYLLYYSSSIFIFLCVYIMLIHNLSGLDLKIQM